MLSIEELRDLIQPYLPEHNNEGKFRIEVKRLVKAAKDLGFLRPLSGEELNYEVCAIIKAKIDAEMLENLKIKLEDYLPEEDDNTTD